MYASDKKKMALTPDKTTVKNKRLCSHLQTYSTYAMGVQKPYLDELASGVWLAARPSLAARIRVLDSAICMAYYFLII